MSPKPGRPYEDISRKGRLEIRTSEQDLEMLEFCVKKTGKTKAEIIREGIKKMHDELEQEKYFYEDEEPDEDIVLMVNITCPHCDKNNRIKVRDYENDCSCDDRGEDSMGDEVEYFIECDAFECKACGKEFSFNGSVWEYPIGVINYKEINTEAIEK